MTRRLLPLVHNESLKLLRRRRPHLVLALLVVFLAIAAWAQERQLENQRGEASAAGDWRVEVQGRIEALDAGARRRRIFTSFSRLQRFEAARLRYHLARGIDPGRQTGPLFSRGFAALASALLLPLLVTILGADLVSGEEAAGTIKMLLTRPVARSRILASKLVTLFSFAGLLVGAAAVLSWAIGGVAFGWSGWGAPVFTGLRFTADGVDTTAIRTAPLWLDTLACYGLAWFSTVAVGALAVTFSVLFRSAVGAMGTLMAVLVAGTLLGQLASDWAPARWLFPTNLGVAQWYGGAPPPVDGMTVGHAVGVLAAWSASALVVAFVVFDRRDVTA